jgi:hypothetical protein
MADSSKARGECLVARGCVVSANGDFRRLMANTTAVALRVKMMADHYESIELAEVYEAVWSLYEDQAQYLDEWVPPPPRTTFYPHAPFNPYKPKKRRIQKGRRWRKDK